MIRKNMVFLWVTALLPLLLCLWFYPQLPELIPTNFNNGEITKYGPKATIWIIGGLGPVIALLFTNFHGISSLLYQSSMRCKSRQSYPTSEKGKKYPSRS